MAISTRTVDELQARVTCLPQGNDDMVRIEGNVFQEWDSTGSLLWIHGKRTFFRRNLYLSLIAPAVHSRFGEEHPLVRHFNNLSFTR
jgi:hypothetical protein